MYFNIAVVLSTLVAFAAAGGYGSGYPSEAKLSQCNTNGGAKCCNQLFDAKTLTAEKAGLLGINLSGLTGQIGLGCSAVSAIGVLNGANCASSPVCCQGNQANGAVNVGCNPISA